MKKSLLIYLKFSEKDSFSVKIIFREKKDVENWKDLCYGNDSVFPFEDIVPNDTKDLLIQPFIQLNNYILDFNQNLGILIPRIIEESVHYQSIQEISNIEKEDISLISFFISSINQEYNSKKCPHFISLFLDQFNINRLQYPYSKFFYI